MATNPLTGEVYLVDLGMIGKRRPFVIVSRRDPKAPRALVTAVPLTGEFRGCPDYEVPMPKVTWLHKQSYANVQGTMSFELVELLGRIGRFEPGAMQPVKAALRHWLDL